MSLLIPVVVVFQCLRAFGLLQAVDVWEPIKSFDIMCVCATGKSQATRKMQVDLNSLADTFHCFACFDSPRDPLVISELVGLVFTAWMIWVPSVAPLSLDGDGEESDPRLATPTATVTSAAAGTEPDFSPAPSSSSSSQMPYASPSQSHSRARAHSSALSFEAIDEARYYGDDSGVSGEAVGVGGAVRIARPAASTLGAPAPASALNGFVTWCSWLLTFVACTSCIWRQSA
jgi:hypothetical protein